MRIPIIHSTYRPGGMLVAVIALAAIFLADYLPDLGHGFLKDDFGWVLKSRAYAWDDLPRLFTANVGFYRPLVSLSFAADHALWTLNPFGYGMTNLALCLADAVLLFALAGRLALPAGAATVSAAAWAFNFHGINMALLWFSGRTALLVVLFALATALAMLRDRRLLGGFLCLCAMLSKEEAVLIPALWTAFAYTDVGTSRSSGLRQGDHRSTASRLAAHVWPLWAALAIYATLRSRTGAFGLQNAPPEYQLLTSFSGLVTNIVEYADRAGTLFVLVGIAFAVAAGRKAGRLSDGERRTLTLAALWIPASLVLTISLPSRSSLYVLLPSIGSALVAGAIASRTLRASPQRFARVAAAMVLILLMLVPVYRARNRRWVESAELASKVVEIVRTSAARHPVGGRIELIDDAQASPNFASIFLTAFPEMVTLVAGDQWTGEIVDHEARRGDDARSMATVVVRLADGVAEVTD